MGRGARKSVRWKKDRQQAKKDRAKRSIEAKREAAAQSAKS